VLDRWYLEGVFRDARLTLTPSGGLLAEGPELPEPFGL
jgi:hypothetical protein